MKKDWLTYCRNCFRIHQSGAIYAIHSRQVTVNRNIVAGAEMPAYRLPVKECGHSIGAIVNEAHSSYIGLSVTYNDNQPNSCLQISYFIFWNIRGIGIDYLYSQDLIISHNTFVGNKIGTRAKVIGPSSVNHVYGDSSVQIHDNLFIGRDTGVNCSEFDTGTGNTEGNAAIVLPSFRSNDYPYYFGYPSLNSHSSITGRNDNF